MGHCAFFYYSKFRLTGQAHSPLKLEPMEKCISCCLLVQAQAERYQRLVVQNQRLSPTCRNKSKNNTGMTGRNPSIRPWRLRAGAHWHLPHAYYSLGSFQATPFPTLQGIPIDFVKYSTISDFGLRTQVRISWPNTYMLAHQ